MLQLVDHPLDPYAWEHFLKVGLPTKGHEHYRYVRLKELYSQPFHLPGQIEKKYPKVDGTLVFLNGVYTPTLSSPAKPFIPLPLGEAIKTYGSFLNPRMHKQLKEEKDPFALVNAAYFSGGLFLYLPPKTRFEGNLRIIHLIEGLDQPTLLTPRIHFFIGKQASAKIIYTQKSPLKNIWVNAYMDFALEEEATLKLATISEQDAQSHDFLTLRASLKSRSHFKSCGITNGGATSRHDYCVHLQGEEAHASLNGIWNIKQNRQHHVNVWMEHQEPHATSLQKFKGIVSDNGRSSFEGKIYVHKEAQKTEAYQMSNNLLLSEHATAYAKPNLEIFADDVKASHGATVGQLDEESLFYLKSRGIPLSLARNLLIQGFLEEILSFFDEKTIRKEAAEVVT